LQKRATVERLLSGGRDECALTAQIDGLGDAVAPGGTRCDAQGFDGNVSDERVGRLHRRG
jgi:hypothetical protein